MNTEELKNMILYNLTTHPAPPPDARVIMESMRQQFYGCVLSTEKISAAIEEMIAEQIITCNYWIKPAEKDQLKKE